MEVWLSTLSKITLEPYLHIVCSRVLPRCSFLCFGRIASRSHACVNRVALFLLLPPTVSLLVQCGLVWCVCMRPRIEVAKGKSSSSHHALSKAYQVEPWTSTLGAAASTLKPGVVYNGFKNAIYIFFFFHHHYQTLSSSFPHPCWI